MAFRQQSLMLLESECQYSEHFGGCIGTGFETPDDCLEEIHPEPADDTCRGVADAPDAVEGEGLDDCGTMKGFELSGRSDTLLIDDPCRTTAEKDPEVKDVCAGVLVSSIGLFADDSCARRPSRT